MTTHRVYKAQGIGKTVVESTTIIFDREFPNPISLDDAMKLHGDAADRLADVLCNTLPGGTLDRLIAKLLERKASALIVPLFKPKGGPH